MESIVNKTIAIRSNIFDDAKMKAIELLPDKDTIIVIWFKFLMLAKKHNNRGKLMIGEDMPFTDKELSIVFNRPLGIVKKAIKVLMELGEIEINNGIITVCSKITDSQFDRNSPEYRTWRRNVFTRDNFTCSKCKISGGRIEAHHVKQWSKYLEYRYDINNGITLCHECHKKLHRKQGV